MNASHRLCLLLAAAVAAGNGPLGSAAEGRRNAAAKAPVPPASVVPKQGFDAFQLVVERNIFNPHRTGRTRPGSEEKPPRVDEISLVGTVQFGRENLAVFDSPEPAFCRSLHEGESVGDFTVRRITADTVELTRAGQSLALKVSQQLRRVEGGDWTVTANQAAKADPRAIAGHTAAAPRPVDFSAPVEVPADASEVLKRLMKKREKQLK
ncbi:MAG: hypothetical protein FJ399_08685 [Verrucomicrobia bacterium]|nr:hypothetical protein [Verrucomicrobiota bacterium]